MNKIYNKSRQGNAELMKGRNFPHGLAVCLQKNMGTDLYTKGATDRYGVLAQHMRYACDNVLLKSTKTKKGGAE